MIRYFYNLQFEYETGKSSDLELLTSSFNIGYFSTKKNAEKQIANYKSKPGFNKHPVSCFKIIKTGVNFPKKCHIVKANICLYELSYENISRDDDFDEWVIFGVFSSRDLAEQELIKQSKRKKYKKGEFNISNWMVDSTLEWREGFDSIEN